jgi:hypothetical protein
MSGGGGGGGSAVSNDPAMRNTPVGGGSVPTTTKATGKGGIGDTEAIVNDLKKISDGIENSNNKTKEVLDDQLNIEAPGLAPGQLGFLNDQQIGSPATGNLPSVVFDPSTVPMPTMPRAPMNTTQGSLNQLVRGGVPVGPDTNFYYDVPPTNQQLINQPNSANVIPATNYDNQIIDARAPVSSPYFTVVR